MRNQIVKAFLFLSISLLLVISCKKRATAPTFKVSKWVESVNRADTIEFKNDMFLLNRGQEMINGSLRYKPYGGPYLYKEKKDSIGLRHFSSSLGGYESYSYKIEANRLYIGDFYKKTGGQNQTLVFIKLN